METCKNRITGKTFITVDYVSDDRALMITPAGDIKNLEIRLFDDFKGDQNPSELLERGEISKRQYDKFNRYMASS